MSLNGLAPRLPLVYDSEDGPYRQITRYTELVKQNFKMLLLTSPGERIMIPDYGVGIRNYLFELKTPETYEEISAKISEQTKRYMPFIQLTRIRFDQFDDFNENENLTNVVIDFFVAPLQKTDSLTITGEFDRRVFV
jgi:phage baseplate assembly protein W